VPKNSRNSSSTSRQFLESAGRSKLQVPILADEILSEAVVFLFCPQFKAGAFINSSCIIQDAVCPECDGLVRVTAGEGDALIEEPGPQACSAQGRFDIKQP